MEQDPPFPSVGSLPIDCDIDADSLVSYLTFDAGLQSAGSFLGGVCARKSLCVATFACR